MFRLDALNAFELGQDLSQRNGYLPQVPTGAEILRGAGYYTSHSGKISYIENLNGERWVVKKCKKWRDMTVEKTRREGERREEEMRRGEKRNEDNWS